MEYYFRIGNVGFHFVSQIELEIEETMLPFLCEVIENPCITVEIHLDYEKVPKSQENVTGEDLFLKYYPWRQGCMCVAKAGCKENLAISLCDASFRKIACYLNAKIFSDAAHSIGNILRLLPMRMIFQNHGILFFHASQIAVDQVGILFSAPSGTGKTTQAKLWQKYRNAKIICNDRTLVRDGKTYGYPIDGSEPVISGDVNQLGAVVMLEQSKENHVQRLRPARALSRMMSQLVFDVWSSYERELAILHLMELLGKFPVYLLSCTPAEGAVWCLEQQLKKDGVLK